MIDRQIRIMGGYVVLTVTVKSKKNTLSFLKQLMVGFILIHMLITSIFWYSAYESWRPMAQHVEVDGVRVLQHYTPQIEDIPSYLLSVPGYFMGNKYWMENVYYMFAVVWGLIAVIKRTKKEKKVLLAVSYDTLGVAIMGFITSLFVVALGCGAILTYLNLNLQFAGDMGALQYSTLIFIHNFIDGIESWPFLLCMVFVWIYWQWWYFYAIDLIGSDW